MKISSSPFSFSNRRRVVVAGVCAVTLPLLSVAAALPGVATESDPNAGEATTQVDPGVQDGDEAGAQANPGVLPPSGMGEQGAGGTGTQTGPGAGVQMAPGVDATRQAAIPKTDVAWREPAPNVILRGWGDDASERAFYADIPRGAEVFVGDWFYQYSYLPPGAEGNLSDWQTRDWVAHTLGWRANNGVFYACTRDNVFSNENAKGCLWYSVLPTDEVLIGDWDGDGADTVSVRRGNEFLIRKQSYSEEADFSYTFGEPTDEVLVGDWDGDGVDTVMLRRGNKFLVNNEVVPTGVEYTFWYGAPGERALVGDTDGDGKESVVIKRGRAFHIRHTLTTGNADEVQYLGEAGDVGLFGDWDGDGVATVGVFKPKPAKQLCQPAWFWVIARFLGRAGGCGWWN